MWERSNASLITKLFTLKYGPGTDWAGTVTPKVLSTTFVPDNHILYKVLCCWNDFLFLLLVLLKIVGKSTAMPISTFYLKIFVPTVITGIVTVGNMRLNSQHFVSS